MAVSKFSFLIVFLFYSTLHAQQQTIIKGKVTEYGSEKGIAYATIYFKGSLTGAVTDSSGHYYINTTEASDSLTTSYIGYKNQTKPVKLGREQIINFSLQPQVLNLDEIIIKPGVNPAIRIIQNAINKKDDYNRENLISVQYLSYTKQEVDIDNITQKMRKRKFFNPITNLWDSLDNLSEKETSTKLPVAMSEVMAEIYTYKEAQKKHEEVKAVKINFVGMKDGTALSKLMGTDFLNYNFCNNNVPVLEKDFLSPIADNALLFYRYYLTDSLFIDGIKCYKIDLKPKNSKDLAYTGTLWITDSTFAIKQLNLEITRDVNFNLVDHVRIQQQLIPTEAGPWIPVETNVVIDYTNVTKKMVSSVIHTHNINSHYVINQPKEKDFYDTRLQFEEDAITKDSTYWITQRPTPISRYEEQTYKVIDTIRRIPFVEKTVNVFYFLFSGYLSAGPLDFGHYMQLYAHNNYEGERVRLGFKTNEKLSNKWIARGYGAYGFKDEDFKYTLQLERILSKYPWSKVGIQYRKDIDQLGVNTEYSRTMNLSQPANYLYNMFSQVGNVNKLVRKEESRVWYENELFTGFNTRVTFQNIHYSPLFSASFGDPLSSFQTTTYTASEIVLEGRFSKQERYIQNGLDRISLGNRKSPIITFNYTQGIKNIWGSDFNYQKAFIGITNRFRFATLGYSQLYVKVGKVFSKIPFTSLEIPRGNETFFYAENVYNLMQFFEFVSDQYTHLFYQHHFMGFFFNRVPLIKKMNLRETIGFNAFYGTLSKTNQHFNSSNVFTQMTDTPYCETSIGIENIFRIIHIDFIYRLTYTDAPYKNNYILNNPNESISNWGIKAGLKFSF